MKKWHLAAWTLLLCSSVFASTFEEGVAAYEKGDFATALGLFREVAENGDPLAQNKLATMYALGEGVPKNASEAVKWYRKSAEKGNAVSQGMLALQFYIGNGVKEDHKEAAKWWRKSADQGNSMSQCSLAGKYHRGDGVPQDYKEAAKWYLMSAEQGNSESQYNLAVMYDNGEGVHQDFKEAIKWWRKAAEDGYDFALFNLGVRLHSGKGVAQNVSEAYFWLNLAVSQAPEKELEEWTVERDKVAAELTTDERERVQARQTVVGRLREAACRKGKMTEPFDRTLPLGRLLRSGFHFDETTPGGLCVIFGSGDSFFRGSTFFEPDYLRWVVDWLGKFSDKTHWMLVRRIGIFSAADDK